MSKMERWLKMKMKKIKFKHRRKEKNVVLKKPSIIKTLISSSRDLASEL